jgi:hypothetical protein
MKVELVNIKGQKNKQNQVDRIVIQTDRGYFFITPNREGLKITKNGEENLSILPEGYGTIIVE